MTMRLPARAAHGPGVAAALGAAVLFGVSTPLAKVLVGRVEPVLLAGLLYLGVQAQDPRWIVTWFALALGAVGASEGPFWATAIELGGRRGVVQLAPAHGHGVHQRRRRLAGGEHGGQGRVVERPGAGAVGVAGP